MHARKQASKQAHARTHVPLAMYFVPPATPANNNSFEKQLNFLTRVCSKQTKND
jgi:hypothetical protein